MRKLLALTGVLIAGCGTTHHTPTPTTGQRVYQTPFGPSPHAPGFGHEPVPNLPRALAPTAVPTVEMFDTITLSTIPPGARVLAGYTAGSWPTYLPLVHRYPKARVKSIAISRHYDAQCLDIEPGDARPQDAPGWYQTQRARGIKPCLYTSLSEWSQVFSYMHGIPRSSYWAWDAHYDYFAHIDVGFDGTQWTDRSHNSNLDESTITLAFAGVPQCDQACHRHRVDHQRRVDRAHLHALLRERARVRRQLLWSRHGFSCRVPHPRRQCRPLLRRGDLINREIRVLRARGAR